MITRLILIALCFTALAFDYNDIVPKKEKDISIIVYSRDGCSGCKKMEPIVKEIKESGQYNISTHKNDPDFEGPVPTIVVLVDGNEVRRHTGELSKQALIAFINEN
jgi:thiol-disulfide isomerase/thioredoxin